MNSISSRAENPPYFQLYPPAGDSLYFTLFVGIRHPERIEHADEPGIIVTADTTFPEFKDMVKACFEGHWTPVACIAYWISMKWDATTGGRMLEDTLNIMWLLTQQHIARQKDSRDADKSSNEFPLQTVTRPLSSCENVDEACRCA
ncbi:hypothetical protein LTS10_010484 [Elasticomyces elasticus]|nr:hypothetical protein LTS10_010484 [Elasticomyces elasticus]